KMSAQWELFSKRSRLSWQTTAARRKIHRIRRETMKKRGLALLMALALTLSLAACGGTEETTDDTADTAEETIPSGGEADLAEEETPEEETPEEDGTTEAIDEIEKEETDEP